MNHPDFDGRHKQYYNKNPSEYPEKVSDAEDGTYTPNRLYRGDGGSGSRTPVYDGYRQQPHGAYVTPDAMELSYQQRRPQYDTNWHGIRDEGQHDVSAEPNRLDPSFFPHFRSSTDQPYPDP